MTTRSIAGSSMAANDGLHRRSTRRSARSGCSRRSQADVAILHAPVADRAGNVAIAPPLLEGVWGALGARRGAIVTVERIVDDLSEHCGPRAHPRASRPRGVRGRRSARIPAGCFTGELPVDGYGEDYDFWVEAPRRDPERRLRRVDPPLGPRAGDPGGVPRTPRRRSGGAPAGQGEPAILDARRRERRRLDLDAPANAWEHAASYGARHLADRVAGARRPRGARGRRGREPRGLARRAARPRAGVATCSSPPRSGCGGTSRRSATRSCSTTATSRPRRCSATRRWCSADVVGGAGTTTIGCLGGAQVDRPATSTRR